MTIDDDPLTKGAKLKIRRAQKHINELGLQIEEFMKRKPFRLIVKHRPNAGQYLIVTKCNARIPSSWSLIIGDAVHNLWSALDHVIYAMASDRGDENALMFPFVWEEKNLIKKIKSTQVEFAGTEVVNYIRSLKPYRNGNVALSGIYRLDTRDKHKLLILALTVLDFHKALLRAVIPGNPIIPFLKPMDIIRIPHPDEDEVQLFSGNADYRSFGDGNMSDREEETYIQPPYRIAFGEGQPFEGEQVIQTLRNCTYVIEAYVNSLVIAFRRPENIRPVKH